MAKLVDLKNPKAKADPTPRDATVKAVSHARQDFRQGLSRLAAQVHALTPKADTEQTRGGHDANAEAAETRADLVTAYNAIAAVCLAQLGKDFFGDLKQEIE